MSVIELMRWANIVHVWWCHDLLTCLIYMGNESVWMSVIGLVFVGQYVLLVSLLCGLFIGSVLCGYFG